MATFEIRKKTTDIWEHNRVDSSDQDLILSSEYFKLTDTPSSGGAQVIDFYIRINGSQPAKSVIQVDTSSNNIWAYIGGIFLLSTVEWPFK